MQLNPTDRKLALVMKAMQELIIPELKTGAAQAVAGIITATLGDILKQEHGTAAILQECLHAGLTLAAELDAALASATASPGDGSELRAAAASQDMNVLLAAHAQLTALLAGRCEQLAALTTAASNGNAALLRRAAEWELSYYTRQAQLPVPALPVPPAAGSPLDRESLQAYLNTVLDCRAGAVSVTAFHPLSGGFGKQTYLCEYRHGDGPVQDLVIRKTDPAPIMQHGACLLENEHDLLCALATTGYPAPRPLHFCQHFQDVDGTFYMMEKIAGSPPGGFLDGMTGAVDEGLFLQLAELLGRLHSVPLATFSDYIARYESPRLLEGTVADCYRHNLDGWAAYMQREAHLQSPYLVWLLDWLNRNIPRDARRPILIHGDFNIHNVLVDQGRVTAILDWECAGFGCPEQDLAYIQPHIAQHIDWDKFVAHYQAHGGHPLNPDAMAFGMVYAALRTNLAGNRATRNLQSGANSDLRYAMVELGFTASFMGMALASAN